LTIFDNVTRLIEVASERSDNAHDAHHKHEYGVVSAVDYSRFEEIETMFVVALMQLLNEARK
jgi:hypothetical protein